MVESRSQNGPLLVNVKLVQDRFAAVASQHDDLVQEAAAAIVANDVLIDVGALVRPNLYKIVLRPLPASIMILSK